jgi:hypothetical protein
LNESLRVTEFIDKIVDGMEVLFEQIAVGPVGVDLQVELNVVFHPPQKII